MWSFRTKHVYFADTGYTGSGYNRRAAPPLNVLLELSCLPNMDWNVKMVKSCWDIQHNRWNKRVNEQKLNLGFKFRDSANDY